ncbi:MAG TPA: hypothetical protein VM261_36480 [Kofleriaceae bacterium]|nr:hypothetical protein [Kofleriaceae bacterium]
MTSSETPTEPQAETPAADEAAESSAESPAAATSVAEMAPLPRARVAGKAPFPPWLLAAAVIPPGWFYILRIVRWHFTPSAVMLMICWVAIVTVGYFAIRMALAAASPDDARWFTARGEREELEREKKSLLKAIKEIEFDRETGKLSPADAASLTATYRARAIEVIKSIEAEAGTHVTVREQILAEVRARKSVDAKVKHAKQKKEKKAAAAAKAKGAES